jgi:hypothetical protein
VGRLKRRSTRREGGLCGSAEQTLRHHLHQPCMLLVPEVGRGALLALSKQSKALRYKCLTRYGLIIVSLFLRTSRNVRLCQYSDEGVSCRIFGVHETLLRSLKSHLSTVEDYQVCVPIPSHNHRCQRLNAHRRYLLSTLLFDVQTRHQLETALTAEWNSGLVQMDNILSYPPKLCRGSIGGS